MTKRMPSFSRAASVLAAVIALGASSPGAFAVEPGSDYSTEVKVEYVLACMESAGQTRDALARCSCSIDVIASILPYEKYVEAETIISVGLAGGERTGMMKSEPSLREKVADMRRAQAEAEIRCF